MVSNEEKRFSIRLKRCCTSLNNLLDEAREIWPDATLYLSPNNLNLLSGTSHEGNGTAHRERVITRAKLNADGGDW